MKAAGVLLRAAAPDDAAAVIVVLDGVARDAVFVERFQKEG